MMIIEGKVVSIQLKSGEILEGTIKEVRLPWFTIIDHEKGRRVVLQSEVEGMDEIPMRSNFIPDFCDKTYIDTFYRFLDMSSVNGLAETSMDESLPDRSIQLRGRTIFMGKEAHAHMIEYMKKRCLRN